MLLTLTLHTSDAAPATDLGYLLHKHPARVFESALPFGTAQVFYSHNTPERSTAVLLLDVDPVALSRRFRGGNPNAPLEPYVNDRPYASGSFLALALRDAFGTALSGRSKDRQALAELALPFEIELPCLPVRGPADLPERLFGPLGYAVDLTPIPLDPHYPEWGERPYVALKLSGTVRLRDLLAHLYVLLLVLDTARKHHFLDEAELEKLLRRGEGWLEAHPERDLIATRYLQLRSLIRQAAEHFAEAGESDGTEEPAPETLARTVHAERLAWVAAQLRASGAQTVLDLGCGEGRLLKLLLPVAQFRELVGLDVSARALEIARRRLKLDERPELAQRVKLLHSSLTYRDARLHGFGAAALVEVIEHLDVGRLDVLAANVFGDARPSTVIVTTPNREYNAVFEGPARMRHTDHRFEWTRAEFRTWADGVAAQYGYAVKYTDVGDVHPEFGPLTQAGVFERV